MKKATKLLFEIKFWDQIRLRLRKRCTHASATRPNTYSTHFCAYVTCVFLLKHKRRLLLEVMLNKLPVKTSCKTKIRLARGGRKELRELEQFPTYTYWSLLKHDGSFTLIGADEISYLPSRTEILICLRVCSKCDDWVARRQGMELIGYKRSSEFNV